MRMKTKYDGGKGAKEKARNSLLHNLIQKLSHNFHTALLNAFLSSQARLDPIGDIKRDVSIIGFLPLTQSLSNILRNEIENTFGDVTRRLIYKRADIVRGEPRLELR